MKKKKNYLLERIVEIMSSQERGKVLDLGCGDGKTGKKLLDKGFDVEAYDMDVERFNFHEVIPFKEGSLNRSLPYPDNYFDYVILMEVIEHIYNPDSVISEINRILKNNGKLILSTPNILNVGSRFRFLIEGNFNFFREPTLDFSKCFPVAIQNMHIVVWRYQELEYLLDSKGLKVENFYTDKKENKFYLLAILLRPIILMQLKIKENRSRRKRGVDFSRINKILLSREIMLGRHLILEAIKK